MTSIFFKGFLIAICLNFPCSAQNNCDGTSAEEIQVLSDVSRRISTEESTTPSYHVSLMSLDTENFEISFMCSGALISVKHVLTSAKCLERASLWDVSVVAVVGKTIIDPNNPETYYSTGKYIQYDTESKNGISILPLLKPVNIVIGKVEIVKLPASQSKIGICNRKLKDLPLSGRGIEFGTNIAMEGLWFQNNAKVTRHDVVGRIKCNWLIKRKFGNNQGSLMCTKPKNYQSCIGDLGSPLVKPSSDGYGNELLGLAVYDMKACRTNHIIYNYIPAYVSWINWIIYNGLSN